MAEDAINYEEDVVIDESMLDVEWLDQPRMMMKYTQYAAEARKRLDEAKEAMDVKYAELDRDIRDNPSDFELEKITETIVQETIKRQEDYKEAVQEWIDAKYEWEMATAAVRAMDQRKVALENLVRLHGMSYFAGPSAPRDLTEERENAEKERQKRANKAASKGKQKGMKRSKNNGTE